MSDNPVFNIFSDEEINDLKGTQLRPLLKERGITTQGNVSQLKAHLRNWQRDYEPPAVEEEESESENPEVPEETAPPVDAPSESASETEAPEMEATNEGDSEENPPAPSDPDAAPPETADLQTSDPETDPPEAPSEALRGGPRRGSAGTVLSREDRPAEDYRELCKTCTLVRTVGSPVVQKFDIPFGLGGKQRAFQTLGIKLRSFINEELEALEPPEEAPSED